MRILQLLAIDTVTGSKNRLILHYYFLRIYEGFNQQEMTNKIWDYSLQHTYIYTYIYTDIYIDSPQRVIYLCSPCVASKFQFEAQRDIGFVLDLTSQEKQITIYWNIQVPNFPFFIQHIYICLSLFLWTTARNFHQTLDWRLR